MNRFPKTRTVYAMLIAILCALSACKKDGTGPKEIPFDPAFVGVWYSDSNAVGFEVLADGSSKTLVVDTAGTLQYATPGSGTSGAISLTLSSGRDGNLSVKIRYYVQGFNDTTVILPGTYTFSNNNNSVSITFPNPASGGQLETMVFRRSSIGALVRPRSGSAQVGRRSRGLNSSVRFPIGLFPVGQVANLSDSAPPSNV
jgi:hypothetical protein